jgi:hypothetical protein
MTPRDYVARLAPVRAATPPEDAMKVRIEYCGV